MATNKNAKVGQEMSKSINEESIFDDKFSVKNLQFRKIINTTANNKEKHREILVFLCFHSDYRSVCSCFFSNTPHVFSQVAAFIKFGWLVFS